MRSRIVRASVVGLASLSLLLAACTTSSKSPTHPGKSASSTAPTKIKNGGVLRIGVTAAIDTLNPFTSQSDYSSVVYQYVYPHLVQYNAHLQLVGSFANSWQQSEGGRTWTFHTVSGAKWSDGKPLTAADAAFTLTMMNKYQNGPTGDLAQLITGLKSATAPDPNTLVLQYSAPVSNVLAQMQGVHILPEQVWGPLATGNGAKIRTFANDSTPMVSGGPFMMVKYTQNQIALFRDNPDWWGPKPHIDGFGIQMFGTTDAMVTALKSGQLDMIGESTPPTVVATLKQAGMDVLTAPSLTFYDFIINTTPTMKKHRELLNPQVREAMEYALDRQSMIKTGWLGYAQESASVVAPVSGWSDPNLKPLPFSLAKANQLLDQAGYQRGPNGVRVANGSPMSYTLIFPTEINGAGDVMFQIAKNDFAKIGIQLNEQKMDPTAATTAIDGANNSYDGYSLAMWDWVLPPDPSNVLAVLTCAQRGNNSDSGYCNPAYDKLFTQQNELLERSQRQAAVNQMQQIIFNARPYIVLCYPDIIEAHSPKWAGFEMSPLLGSVNNMSIDTLLNVHQVG